MNIVLRRVSSFSRRPLLRMVGMSIIIAAAGSLPNSRSALGQTPPSPIKVACLGEASTHSAHRNYDPEYPELMGIYLDSDFKKDASPQNPASGGMLYGGGTNYRIGNFGIPTGAVIETNLANPQSMISSPQLRSAEAWAPHIVILGPFGPHEALTNANLDTFLPSLRRLVARVVAFPSKPTVYIALPLPRWGMDGEANRRRFNMETAQVIRETGLPSIDFWAPFLGKMAEFADQNHLNLMGRQHMADVAGAVVKTWKPGAGTTDGGTTGDGGVSDGPRPGTDGGSGGRGADGPAGDANGSGGASGSATGGAPASSSGGSNSGGAPATGGAGGTGGSVGTGGAVATSTGGAVGSGGANAGTGGAGPNPGTGGATIPGDGDVSQPGCGCAAAGNSSSSAGAFGLLLLVGLTVVRSRRRAALDHRHLG